jgi:hypothetical protein
MGNNLPASTYSANFAEHHWVGVQGINGKLDKDGARRARLRLVKGAAQQGDNVADTMIEKGGKGHGRWSTAIQSCLYSADLMTGALTASPSRSTCTGV